LIKLNADPIKFNPDQFNLIVVKCFYTPDALLIRHPEDALCKALPVAVLSAVKSFYKL